MGERLDAANEIVGVELNILRGVGWPSGVSDFSGPPTPTFFCQIQARNNQSEPMTDPPKTTMTAPCQPVNAPMAPTNFTSPKPNASFWSAISKSKAIQSTKPDPMSKPWIEIVMAWVLASTNELPHCP